MLRKLLIATVLTASMATPTASHADEVGVAYGLWHSSDEARKFEEPRPKWGLWKQSDLQPAGNFREPASVPSKPRISSESANAPKRSSTQTDTSRVVLRSPYLSTLGLGI